MAAYRDSDGRSVELGTILSRGGEGFIHEVPSLPNLVAKIWRDPNERQARKLEVLLRHAPNLPEHVRARIELAWPSEALYDEHNTMRGYLMPKVPLDQYHELVRYCIPAARRGLEQERGAPFTRNELLTIARNVAEVFRILHVMGYLIGDVNHTNFLVRGNGKTFVIDLDSIQARDPDTGEVHRCTVGKEDFTPPRLMGQRFEDVDRTPDDDMFGLAVLVFQLLMDGNHPFDPVDQTGEEGQVRQSNIRRAYSPYTAIDPVQARAILDLDMIADTTVRERTRENMLALMGVEATADFSTVIGPRISLWLQIESAFQDMFRRAFEDKGSGRPISSEWVQALENAGATILQARAVSPPAPTAPRLAARPTTTTQTVQPAPPSVSRPQMRPGGRPAAQPQATQSASPTPATQPAAPSGSPSTAAQSGSPPASRPRSPLQSAAYHTPSARGGGRNPLTRAYFVVVMLLGIPVVIFGGIWLLPTVGDVIEDWSTSGGSGYYPPAPTSAPPAAPPPAPTLAPPVVIALEPTSTPTLTPTPTETATPRPPTRTPTPHPTPIPPVVIPTPWVEIAEVVVEEGDFIQHTFAWDHDLHGSAGTPVKLHEDSASVWFSPVSHSDWEATITIGADDDSFVGNGDAEIIITNDSGSIEYVLYVTVLDAGEAAAIPTVAPTRTPRPTTTPRPTVTARPTWTPRPTTTPRPTATLLPASQVIFGPASGSIEHDPDDGFIDAHIARDVAAADAIIKARFYNPYSSAQSDWNSGFLFRRTQANWFHAVIITAGGRWLHILSLGDENRTAIDSGFSPSIDTSANGSNLIRVVASSSEGYLFVNGHHVADLYLGDFTEAGGIYAVGGYYVNSEIKGKSTRFEDFTIHTLLEDVPLPTDTPTIAPADTPAATPTPAPAPLPNLVLEEFDICVEGMGCWPKSGAEDGFSGSRRVSITWKVANRGRWPDRKSDRFKVVRRW